MEFWYKKHVLSYLLIPLAWIFGKVVRLRRWAYKKHYLRVWKAPVPVVVVGNITIGGSGKTPFVIWLAQQLQQQGLKVGIVSRGYGGKGIEYPCLVDAQSDPKLVGDEPLLLARRSGAKVAISPKREQSISLLLRHYPLDIILTDDGLQHYALVRNMEIVIIDGQRQLGNQRLLPAGPLRESPSRLRQVDAIIYNDSRPQPQYFNEQIVMRLDGQVAINLKTQQQRSLIDFQSEQIVAMAAIGNPQRFFDLLQQKKLNIVKYKAFMDHAYVGHETLVDLVDNNQHLLMTEKDAVKCEHFAEENWWYVPVEATLNDAVIPLFEQIIKLTK